MLAKAATGELVDGGGGPFDLADMQGWYKERAIRAAVLRYLLAANDWVVDARGVRLRGVRIHGPLDLEEVTLRSALRLEDCYQVAPPWDMVWGTRDVRAGPECVERGQARCRC